MLVLTVLRSVGAVDYNGSGLGVKLSTHFHVVPKLRIKDPCLHSPYTCMTRGGGSTNSVEDRGQRERRSGGGSPLVRGSTQFANE
jgi:hypothetical protein